MKENTGEEESPPTEELLEADAESTFSRTPRQYWNVLASEPVRYGPSASLGCQGDAANPGADAPGSAPIQQLDGFAMQIFFKYLVRRTMRAWPVDTRCEPSSPREPEVPYAPRKPRLLEQVREALRGRHYSYRTEQAYIAWIRRFVLFHDKRHPTEMGKREIEGFLTALAVERNVAASTQNQALAALLFLYRVVLEREPPWLDDVVRAKRPVRLPVVLTRDEVQRLLAVLDGIPWILGMLMYGSGLRVTECLRLRIKDVDFTRHEILIREGEGDKDRVTMLSNGVVPKLSAHLELVRKLHTADLRRGFGRAALPDAVARKYPNVSVEWGWQWIFPASTLSVDPRSGQRRRHHLHVSVPQRAIREAWGLLGIALPIHAALIWLLPEDTLFHVGVAMVAYNLELFAIVVVVDEVWSRERNRKRHAAQRSI